MTPKPKSRVTSTARPRSRTGAGVTGAGSGALLVHVLNGYRNQAWAQILLYLAPSVSLAISACVLWLRAQLDDYLQSKLQEQKGKRQLKKLDKAEKICLAILADDNASTQSKEK